VLPAEIEFTFVAERDKGVDLLFVFVFVDDLHDEVGFGGAWDLDGVVLFVVEVDFVQEVRHAELAEEGFPVYGDAVGLGEGVQAFA
jgi:hypothetical protein